MKTSPGWCPSVTQNVTQKKFVQIKNKGNQPNNKLQLQLACSVFYQQSRNPKLQRLKQPQKVSVFECIPSLRVGVCVAAAPPPPPPPPLRSSVVVDVMCKVV